MKWLCQSTSLTQTKREKLIKTTNLITSHPSTKQREKVSFLQDQQNSSELLDNNTSMTEITPILQTYEQQLETFQTSQTFGTLTTDNRAINFSDTNQPFVSDCFI